MTPKEELKKQAYAEYLKVKRPAWDNYLEVEQQAYDKYKKSIAIVFAKLYYQQETQELELKSHD